MYPLICKIGPISIYSYGLMMAAAVIVCTLLMSRDAHEINVSSDTIFDFMFWVVLSGIIGARVFYILLNFNFFMSVPSKILMIQKGGISWQGGLAGGVIAALIFIKRKGLRLGVMFDFVAPYIALGQSIGRVGCFLNGCCYGKEVAWGVFFPIHGAHLHPTQIYSTLGLLIVFFVLKSYRKVTIVPGQVFVLYLILASILRFFIEFLRADHNVLIFGFSVFQIICIVIFSVGLIINTVLQKKKA